MGIGHCHTSYSAMTFFYAREKKILDQYLFLYKEVKKMVLTTGLLKEMAIEESFKRGRSYYERGMVLRPSIYGDVIQALVRSSRNNMPYLVEIDTKDPLIHSCNCPYFGEGICKHIVALGLTYLQRPGSFQTIRESKQKTAAKKNKATGEEEAKKSSRASLEDCVDRVYALIERSLAMAEDLNSYGGPEEAMDQCIVWMEELLFILDNREDIPASVRKEIINGFLVELLKMNSGLEDYLLQIVVSAAKTNWERSLIRNALLKEGCSLLLDQFEEILEEE